MITSFSDKYRFLSNFYPCKVEFEGYFYPSVEHAYQAAKSIDPVDREMFTRLKTPNIAKQQGQYVVLRDDWDDEKFTVMWELLQQKFQQEDLKQKLADTGTQELIEGNTWGDRLWGQSPVGDGDNILGKFLMQIRDGH